MWRVIEDSPVPNEHVLVKLANADGRIAVIDSFGMDTSLPIPEGYEMVEWRRYPDDRVSPQSTDLTRIKAISTWANNMSSRMGAAEADSGEDHAVRIMFSGAKFAFDLTYMLATKFESSKFSEAEARALLAAMPKISESISSQLDAFIIRRENGES